MFDPDVAGLLPLLMGRLHDPAATVRSAAATGLQQLGAAAQPAVPELVKALDDPDENNLVNDRVSVRAAEALGAIDPHSDAAIRHLIGRLADEDKHRRHHADETLQMLREKAVPSLLRFLGDEQVPRAARLAVVVSLHDVTSSGFSSRLDSSDLQAPAKAAAPFLKQAAQDGDDEVRAAARKLLAAMEPESDATARGLLDAIREGELTDWDADSELSGLKPEQMGVLITGLSDPDDEVRTASAYGLAAMAEGFPRPDNPPDTEKQSPAEAAARARDLRSRSLATDALCRALKDPDTQVRWAAAWGLYVFGTDDRSIAALTEMARDRTTHLRAGAHIRLANTLGGGNGNYCGPVANGKERLCAGAIQALSGFGDRAVPAIPVLIEALADDDSQTRSMAVAVLGEIGPKAKEAVPALVRLLRSKEEPTSALCSTGLCLLPVRRERLAAAAARALGKVGPDARAAVAPLIDALTDPDAAVRSEAAEALGLIGPDAAPAVRALVRALDDSDRQVRDKAEGALGQIGAAAVPALIEVAHRPDVDVRRQAIAALASAGPAAAAAIPDMIRALADPDEEIRTAAAEGIGQISHGPGAAAAIPVLLAASHDPDRFVRKRATAALGELGTSDARIIPALAAAMHDRDRDVRNTAGECLRSVGLPAFGALQALLREDDHELRDDAALALARIADPVYKDSENETDAQAQARVKAPRAALLAALHNPDERIRAGASYALGFLGPGLTPELIKALGDLSSLVRVQAARALGVIGTEAKTALDALRARSSDPDPEVRRTAATAIDAILKTDP